jgi:hypothetical protein
MSSEQNLFESDADLKQRLEGDPWVKEHVSAYALTEFLDSAKVESGHVAHFKYQALEDTLLEIDFAHFLGLIGVSEDEFESHQNKWCKQGLLSHQCERNVGTYCNPQYC